METVLRRLRDLLLIAALVGVCAVLALAALRLRDSHMLALDAHKLLSDTDHFVTATEKRTDPILTHVDRAAGELARASLRQKTAADKMIALLGRSDNLVTEATATVVGMRADMKTVAAQAASTMQTASATARDLSATAGQATVALTSLDRTIQDADQVVNNPNIPALLDNSNQTSGHVNQTTAHLEKTADHLEHYVDRITQPVSAVKSFFWTILGPVATFLGTHF